MAKYILLTCLLFLLAKSSSSKEIEFSTYEMQNVQHINNLLDFPFEFKHKGYWNSRVDRYLFYSMGLATMKKPLQR